jgi:hypothetical protein
VYFGQNLRFSCLKNDKFAAKFAEAGNLELRQVSQLLDSPLSAATLPVIVFHSIFPQAVKVGAPTHLNFFRLHATD